MPTVQSTALRPAALRTCIGAALLCAAATAQAVVTFSTNANGAAPADISTAVADFRSAIGGANNGTGPTNFADGRREINWDGVPNASADPNLLAGNFFNAGTPGRARGLVFSTPGTGFLVSANVASGQPTAFGFPSDFVAFSAERMFTPVGSVVTDLNFFLSADPAAPATTRAFGAVFEDVETDVTTIEYFGAGNALLHSLTVAKGSSGSFSFAGAVFDSAVVSRVRITSGDGVLASNGSYSGGADGVVMDDFIYGEPQALAVPEPATMLLWAAGLAGGLLLRRRQA